MLPDLGFFVTSFTKTVLTGLRVGYLVVPPAYSIRAASILRVSSWSGTYLTGEIATRWVENGTAQRLLEIQRDEARARQDLAAEILGDYIASSHPLSLCAWLKVPSHWTEEGSGPFADQPRMSRSRPPNPSLPDPAIAAAFVSVWAGA